ncbi:hypothetical protein Vretimale_15025 [Volvox reticuliferus]|uniref:Uncharacterized protein n=1 Tax=Volvox reticuliferus TaxID=1737510 RepID=A0A8J4FVD1_9CHLO|nr:hypothetical protein Vretifemale_16358 [Volvox reticuliferus]GIM11540.1 hypothetical protein Vretimale_15025 [Volvox reticuliferus]
MASPILQLRTVVSSFLEAATCYPHLALLHASRETPLWPALWTYTSRSFADRTHFNIGLRGSQANVDVEASESVHPQRRAQRIFAARVERALVEVINYDMRLRSGLVESYGFTVHGVRVTGDRLHATVLWDCCRQPPSLTGTCALTLKRYEQLIRTRLARALQAREVPSLKWRHAALDEHDQQTLTVIQHIEQEQELEWGCSQLEKSASSSGGSTRSSGGGRPRTGDPRFNGSPSPLKQVMGEGVGPVPSGQAGGIRAGRGEEPASTATEDNPAGLAGGEGPSDAAVGQSASLVAHGAGESTGQRQRSTGREVAITGKGRAS